MPLWIPGRKRRSRDVRPRRFRAPPAILIVVVAMGLGGSVAAQPAVCEMPATLPADQGAIPDAMREAATCISHRILDPILARLRARSADDPERLGLLENLYMNPVAAPRPHTGPNATAEFSGRYRVITVDPYFLMETITLADLAGYILAEPDANAAERVVQHFAQTVLNETREAVAGGRAPPPARFSSRRYVSDPATRAMAQVLGHEALSAGLAWTVLHEVAHHELGHTRPAVAADATPTAVPGLTTKRQWEADADEAALDALETMGYGLAPLHAFMQVMDVAERVRRLASAATPAADAAHPTFAARVAALERRDLRTPPRIGNYAEILAPWVGVDGVPVIERTLVPLVEGVPPIAFHESANGFLPFEREGAVARLFGRGNGVRSEVVIDDLAVLRPRLTVAVTSEGTGTTHVSQTRGFRTAFAADVLNEQVGPLTVADLMGIDPESRLAALVREIDPRPATVAAVQRAYGTSLQAFGDAALAFAKGQLDAHAFRQRVIENQQAMAERLRAILGERAYQRLTTAWVNDVAISWAISTTEPAIR